MVFPGFDGGAEWGGSAVDPKTGVLYVNANDIAWTGGLTENKPGGSLGSSLYQSQCSMCHGGDRRGAPPAFPSLVDVDQHLTEPEIVAVVHNGKGRMPAFNFTAAQTDSLLRFLRGSEGSSRRAGCWLKREHEAGGRTQHARPGRRVDVPVHRVSEISRPGWLSRSQATVGNAECHRSQHRAVSLEGTARELSRTRCCRVGGYRQRELWWTDRYRRWSSSLSQRPYTTIASEPSTAVLEICFGRQICRLRGNATPATYRIDGRQYLVIATSNARNPKGPQGATYVAFALP